MLAEAKKCMTPQWCNHCISASSHGLHQIRRCRRRNHSFCVECHQKNALFRYKSTSQNETFTCDEFNSMFSARRNGGVNANVNIFQLSYTLRPRCHSLLFHTLPLSLSLSTQNARLSTCTFLHCDRLGRAPLSVSFQFSLRKYYCFALLSASYYFRHSVRERSERNVMNFAVCSIAICIYSYSIHDTNEYNLEWGHFCYRRLSQRSAITRIPFPVFTIFFGRP